MAVTQPRKKSGPMAVPMRAPIDDESEPEFEDDEEIYTVRMPNSARRYHQPVRRDTLDDPALQQGTFVQRRRSSLNTHPGNGTASKAIDPGPTSLTAGRERAGHFPWLSLLFGMLVMALLVFGLSKFGAWWQIHQDDVTYGRPRTFQMDAVVGHNDSASNPTHFIFENLKGHIIVIEMPGGDATHARVYLGPVLFGDGQDLIPVTGTIKDVNGDGKPDLIINIQDQHIVFINTGTQFRPLQPGEHVNLGG